MTGDIDDLLEGLEGDARAQRTELLQWLLTEGFSLELIRESTLPMFLPAERAIVGDGRTYSPQEVAELTGLSLDTLAQLRRAEGVTSVVDESARIVPESELEAAKRVKAFLDAGITLDNVLAVARVLSHGFAQAAEVMRQTVLEAVLQPDATELQLARNYAAVVEQVAPLMGPMVTDLLNLHLRQMVETEALNTAERQAGVLPGAREVSILFGDLVGFTRMGEELDPATLQEVAAQLADLARAEVEAPVRFIKTIGDAVMLVCPEPAPLLRTGLALIAAADARGAQFPQLRVGIATGPAVSRAGDWFGHPVNLASRVTAVARPGSVLVDPATHERLEGDDGVEFSYAGERRLKGIHGHVKLFRARPPRPEAGS